jgi:hypothetical protein
VCSQQRHAIHQLKIIKHAVALYVKRGMCSFETKAKYASKYIHPPGIVQFLIIDGDHHAIGGNEEDGLYDPHLELAQPSGLDISDFLTLSEPGVSSSAEYAEELMAPSASSFDFVSRALRKKRKNITDNVTVSILHVSYATGYNLLELLLREFPSTQAAGGTMLELTGDLPSNSDQQKKVIWLCFMVILGMVACLCLLSSISSLLEASQPMQQAPSRPRRRRLKPWQVRSKFPLGVFDGSQVNFVPPRRHGDHDCENPAHDLKGNEKEDESQTLLPSPLFISDDTCTICLDDFNPGDKLRCLPCQHYFHSPCITKWLTERAATCPLCKVDLYESDDEEEEDDDEQSPSQTPLAFSWNSVPPETRAALTAPHPVDTEPTPTETSGERWQRRGRALGSWGRSLFRRPSDSQPEEIIPATSLTEPLLTEGNHEATTEELQVVTSQQEGTSEVVPTPEAPPTAQDSPVEEQSSSPRESREPPTDTQIDDYV